MSVVVKENTSISRKITLIFVAIMIIEAILFMMTMSIMMKRIKKEATLMTIDNRMDYIEQIESKYSIYEAMSLNTNDSFAIYINEDERVVDEGLYDLIIGNDIDKVIDEMLDSGEENGEVAGSTDDVYFMKREIGSYIVIVASDGRYLNNILLSNIFFIVIIYSIIFLLGSTTIVVTINSFVSRINKICNFVKDMPGNNYKNAYIDDGDDEIENLSRKIDDMRRTINKDEADKDLMLQNISHDLKTPIAVIRSYAEAIEDGVLETSKAEVIIEQSNKLEKKVRNLIELNKLEYLLYEGGLDDVELAPVIEEVVDNYRFVTASIEFNLDLDDTKFLGKKESYYIVIENIIENSVRYAKKEISVTLKNKVLKIHNDGEPIGEAFIKKGFRPYEKGHNGKFGLGMSIVSKTLEYFNMAISVANENDGVTFTIRPKGE